MNGLRESVPALIFSLLAICGNGCSSEKHTSSLDASAGAPEGGGDTGGPDVGSSDAADAGEPPADCGAAPENDAECPQAYTTAVACQPCSPVGLTCVYPDAGHGTLANGCPQPAQLGCTGNDAGFGCPACWSATSGWTCPTKGDNGHWLVAQ